MRRALSLACILAGCTPDARFTGNVRDVDARSAQEDVDAAADVDAAPVIDAPLVSLPTTPGVYRGSCDGSAAVALDADHFAGFSDNDQRIRVFERGMNAQPIQTIDMGASLGVTTGKIDFEDVERIENRIYALSSHGRNNDGVIEPERYRFVAFDVGGAAPSFTFSVAGSRSSLLTELLATGNWIKPDTAVINALANASQLGTQTNANLAPKVNGLNMEGIARAPYENHPNRLLVALRNPRPNGKAIVVSLTNPDDFIGGAKPLFGEAFQLDFGGLGIRGMTWAPSIGQVLIIAGPHDDSSAPFRLYRWRGTPGTTPTWIKNLQAPELPPNMKPEGIVRYPGTSDVEIVLDADDVPIGGVDCDDAASNQRYFSDMILQVQ